MVLVVDTNRTFVTRAVKALADAGVTAHGADTLGAALEAAMDAPVDLVIHGADVEGLERLSTLDVVPPRLLVLPSGTRNPAAAASRDGADAWVTRPVAYVALAAAAQGFLRAGTLARRLARTSALDQERGAIDPATGFYRFERFKPMLAAEVKRARRYRYPFTVLIVSFDGLAGIRQRHGAEVADTLTGGLQRVISRTVRDLDLPVTFRGDTYLVLMPHTPRRGGRTVAERLRRQLRRTRLSQGRQKVGTTVSIGLAAYDGRGEISFASLAREASEALRIAEGAGGDRVAEVPATRRMSLGAVGTR